MKRRILVAELSNLRDGGGVRVDAVGHRIAVFRVGDSVYAIGDQCTHAEASLAEGEIFNGAVECPRHGSEFDLQSGEPSSFPATKPVEVYEAEVEDGDVYLMLEPLTEEAV